MSETNLPLDTLQSSVERRATERQAILDLFAEKPEDNTVWDTAYAWVRADGDDAHRLGVASNIPGRELIGMAETVRAADPGKRYDLMTRSASNGQLWFDAIEGFSSKPVRQVLKHIVEASAQQNQTPFYNALDLGTGVGNSIEVLEQNAEHVIGVDRNQALLDIAKQRAGAHTTLVRADISKLPFANSSFDLVNSLGVEGSLDKEASITFYTELTRVMMPGGVYISAFYNYPDMPSEEMSRITQTSKAMLADMICDTVSGGASVADRLDNDETEALLTSLGLHKQYYRDVSEDEKNHVVIQIITKDQ